jgi:hypothetical protein
MDSRFINYTQRLEYARFMIAINRKEDAINHLQDLINEFEQMLPMERRDKRKQLQSIKSYKTSIIK